MSKHIKIENDFGSVDITPEFAAAVDLINEAAETLQMTGGELMDEFVYGVPECPCCAENKH